MKLPYRTLITGELVQESALSVGGNRPHGLVDLPLALDGAGRPVLRGSTLAGVFIHTARRFLGRELPQKISSPPGENKLVASRWRFEHSHLRTGDKRIFCQHVSIDQRTGAAADDHLFSLEAVPRGRRWNFFMEIAPQAKDDSDDEIREIEALTLPVLREWSRPGGCRLGRGNRHGYGWLHLENLRIFRLDAAQARLWPNSAVPIDDAEALTQYFAAEGIAPLDLAGFAARIDSVLEKLAPHPGKVVELKGVLEAGERHDEFGEGYGLDSLSIGGHARLLAQAERWHGHINQPRGIPPIEKAQFTPDFLINAIERDDGGLEPYIPGAGMRGVWRAAMSRELRSRKIAVRNPGGANKFDKTGERNLVDRLFGDTGQAGALSFADAYPADDEWLLSWQQHVAIDELTGGAYESSKFDRLALLAAHFGWRVRIDVDDESEAKELAQAVEKLINTLGHTRHLPLGGGQWRGHGHVQWQIGECVTRRLGDPA